MCFTYFMPRYMRQALHHATALASMDEVCHRHAYAPVIRGCRTVAKSYESVTVQVEFRSGLVVTLVLEAEPDGGWTTARAFLYTVVPLMHDEPTRPMTVELRDQRLRDVIRHGHELPKELAAAA